MLRPRPVAAFLLLLATPPLHLLAVSAAAAAANEVAVPAGAAMLPDGDLGVSPQYFLGGMVGSHLRARQDERSCRDPDHHVCAELGSLGESACCPDDRYCQSYYHSGNNTWEVKCCAFGSVCGSPCSESQYQGNLTSTITSMVTPTDVVIGTDSSLLSESLSTTVVVGGGCVPRACTSTFFKCASSLGGNCCAFGQTCVTGGNCVGTVSATPTGGVPPANGCPSPSQFQCPHAAHGDCCFTGQACVTSSGTPACSGAPAGPPGSEITRAEGGLSTSAQAGIGAGVAVGGLIVLGLLAWFCLRRRLRARKHASPYRTVDHRAGSAPPAPHGGGEVMSEASGPSRGVGPHRTGLAYDYFGPEAQDGPFTQRRNSPRETPNHGVPAQPMVPSDIAAPVELDSRLRQNDRQAVRRTNTTSMSVTMSSAPSDSRRGSTAPSQGQQDTLALYELYGSLADPSSLPGTEAPSPRSTSPKPR